MEVTSALVLMASAIFVVELTDKDALLLLALATRTKQSLVFAAGVTAFTITTAIIVTIGHFLVSALPVFWIKIAGGIIMIGYGLWEFFKVSKEKEEKELAKDRNKLLAYSRRSLLSAFAGMVSMLAILDLAGDATEILTIVFVARFGNALLVFVGALTGLVAATAVETTIGNQLTKVFSLARIRLFSLGVFLIVGSALIITTALLPV
ncbi:MAG: TMEM165/GDT1 family protein [Candidatus Bathyarchaeia archaeon]